MVRFDSERCNSTYDIGFKRVIIAIDKF
jgi:hypothetical protein